jgi:Prealbumin-like fold domain
MTERILGPTDSRRRRRFLLVPFAALAALVLVMAASGGPVGTAAGFEDDDGNLAPQAPINFDWNSFAPTTWTGTAPFRQSAKTTAGWSFVGLEDAQATNSDTGFAGGTKQDDACATVGGSKAPNKDDLKRIYLSTKTVSGHVFLELAWVRIPQNTTSASAHVGFEFNKSQTACGPASDGLVTRTAGDMLIVYDFEGGSATPVLTLRRWVTSGACEVGSSSPPCWGPATNLTAGGFAEGAVNVGTQVTDNIAPSPGEQLNDSEFGEAGVDLTAAGVFGVNQCESFGKAYAVSRSSGNSAQAAMKDLVGPANFILSNCGQVKIIKRTIPRGVNQDFSFTSTLAGGEILCTPDTTPALFTLNDDAGVDTVPPAAGGNTELCANVPIGSYTVTEGADPAGFVFVSVTCTDPDNGTTTSGKVATIDLDANELVTCIYTNQQQLGAIKITKTAKNKTLGSGDQPHAGVTFTIDSTDVVTGADGTACLDGLAFGDHTVTEHVPAGYQADSTNPQTINVSLNSTCGDGNEAPATFHNTPLTTITVSTNSLAGPGVTESTVQCAAEASPSATPHTTGPLTPGTYTCTVVIDP